jgi:hypothetical protein
MTQTLLRVLFYFVALLTPGICAVTTAATCPSSPPVSADNSINMKDFGAIPEQGSALDIAPLLNCAIGFARSHKLRAINFTYGSYAFKTRPQQIDFPITIAGDGKGRTYLNRTYTASSPSEGFFTFLAGSGGSSVRDLGIVATNSSSHGSAISLIAAQATAPDYCLFSNLYLSVYGGSWDNTVYIDGRARIGTTADPSIGVRDIDFQNCSVFGATNGAILLEGVVGFNFIGGGIFQAGASGNVQTPPSGKVQISPSYKGQKTCDGPYTLESGLPSFYVNINTSFVDGIVMQASCHGHFSAYFSSPVTTGSFSSDNVVIGNVAGGLQHF